MENPHHLSTEQLKQFVDWLQQPGFNNTCPVCNTSEWTVGVHLLRGEAIAPAGSTSAPAYPMAFISCQKCHYVRQFSAVGVGLIPNEGIIHE